MHQRLSHDHLVPNHGTFRQEADEDSEFDGRNVDHGCYVEFLLAQPHHGASGMMIHEPGRLGDGCRAVPLPDGDGDER